MGRALAAIVLWTVTGLLLGNLVGAVVSSIKFDKPFTQCFISMNWRCE